MPTFTSIDLDQQAAAVQLVVDQVEQMERLADASILRHLNDIARRRINTNLITRNWDDLLRVAGSLKLGVVNAHDFGSSLPLG